MVTNTRVAADLRETQRRAEEAELKLQRWLQSAPAETHGLALCKPFSNKERSLLSGRNSSSPPWAHSHGGFQQPHLGRHLPTVHAPPAAPPVRRRVDGRVALELKAEGRRTGEDQTHIEEMVGAGRDPRSCPRPSARALPAPGSPARPAGGAAVQQVHLPPLQCQREGTERLCPLPRTSSPSSLSASSPAPVPWRSWRRRSAGDPPSPPRMTTTLVPEEQRAPRRQQLGV
ncbi:uncharacterized protein LOC141955561 isoform X1 [Athene noctua]|uniref:uncharacterized protein LOC141955553 isoform X1 n=1 Tax=Athene noctua TaxID=126797 RepID=UPI003EBDA5E5